MDEQTQDRFTAEATCRCLNCGEEYTVPANPENGHIDVAEAAEHGTEHPDERWNYEIIERP